MKAYSGRKPPDDDGLRNPLDVENTKASEQNKSEELGTPSHYHHVKRGIRAVS